MNHVEPDNLLEQAKALKYFDDLKLLSATLAGMRKKVLFTADEDNRFYGT